MTNGMANLPGSIAVIGMSGRFPKARNLEELWGNLRDGVECISFFSEDELIASGCDPELLQDPSFVNAGAVLEDLDLFDASFFGFSARDAEVTDPQHRIFLECAVHSLEDAGYNPETYPGLIGVFAGESLSSYVFDLYANPQLTGRLDDFQIAVGNEKDHLATQVSYRLNLRGPSLAIQTACSTSLVAVSMACQSLMNYQCDMALAGGVSADMLTNKGYCHQPGGILSPDGHCRVFDAAAKGTVSGNGVGVVVLKRLSDAIEDRDHIRAVIRGFALNNDGSNKVGYTAPSIEGQAQAVAMAQALARVEPDSISYIEAHGTGTELGDPIEIAALRQAFRGAKKKQFCAIGSVKSNIGHLDAAAGVASLIKTVLALEHKALPPSLHFKRANPKIDFENSPFYVNAALADWKTNDGPRRAGVSCFGIGGTNAHVIVEEAPESNRLPHTRNCCVLKLSGRSSAALEAMTGDLAGYFENHPDIDVADAAFTLDVGRRVFKHRRIVVCSSPECGDAGRALAERDPYRVFSAVCDPRPRPVFFMFPGQGTQTVDMALAVYKTEPVFREEVDRCAEILRPQLGLDLRDLLYPPEQKRLEAASALDQTRFTQPALFAIEYALAKLWMEWGIRPSAMIGHSIGEYVAACLAGVFSLEDALTLVGWRGRLMDEMAPGAMVAVGLSETDARQFLNGSLSLAAVNGPSSCVLAGSLDAVDQCAEHLSRNGTRYQRLRTSHAFHSAMMDSVVGAFVERVRQVRRKAPTIPFQSNLTGEWITADAATDSAYWGKHLRHTVRFSDGLWQLCEAPDSVFLEVGPGQTLSNLVRQQLAVGTGRVVLSSLTSGSDPQSDLAALFGAWGKLWLHGVEGNSTGFYGHDRRRRIPLPGYSFERQRYWIEAPGPNESSDDAGSEVSRNVADWFYYPCWKPTLRPQAQSDVQKQRWLVFSDSNGLGTELTQLLRERGEDVVNVAAGDEFAHLGGGAYTIRPDKPTDYADLLRADLRHGLPGRIVHLWGVSPVYGARDGFDSSQEIGFQSVVRMVQALEKHYSQDPIRITVVSSQIQTVTGNEQICPAKATVLGVCKVIPQEYPNLRCQSVDVDYEGGREYSSRVAADLVAELFNEEFEPVVAWRRGRRWLQAFEAVNLSAQEKCSRLRPGGVYLITGGIGKIGLVLAECLAREAQAKLVLTGRSEFPPRREWRQRLRKDPDSGTSSRIRKLIELEELGAEILFIKADAAEPEEMHRAIAEAETHFGALCGVIHGAGDTESSSPITEIDPTATTRQFRPKANGLMVLNEVLQGKDLDFVLLLSSLSSVLGGLGLAAYAAANTFMDAFASERNREGGAPWISVNWDAWQFPEGESEGIEDAIFPEEGEEAFRCILERAPRQVVVSVSDLDGRLDEWVRIDHQSSASKPAGEELAPQHPRPNLTVAYAAARSDREATLVDIWQQLLGVAPVGVFDNFFELGGHSLLAIQLISRIREAFRSEFPVHKIFESPTIAELAEGLSKDSAASQATTEELLELVEHLSESEIAALLEQDGMSVSEVKLSNA
jgi:acyl transferase domain-containing protein